jgi:hypothetical protein
MEAHKKRELEKLIHDEHTYKKDREKEAGEFEDKETFITGAYRQQIEERNKFREELEERDKFDGRLWHFLGREQVQAVHLQNSVMCATRACGSRHSSGKCSRTGHGCILALAQGRGRRKSRWSKASRTTS